MWTSKASPDKLCLSQLRGAELKRSDEALTAENTPVQSEILLSADLDQDGEAAQTNGCLSILLFPPFSAILFGALLFLGLTRITLHPPTSIEATGIADFFAPQVLHWRAEIMRWSSENHLDPNLVATVMQIESCGNPGAVSSAGAMGLFQVMPYHFGQNENPFSPDTNANRGLDYLHSSLEKFDGDVGMALAGYNGGVTGASRPQAEWAQETIDYKYWGENIFADAVAGRSSSSVLDEWLAAGGASLCAQAEQHVVAAR